MNMLGNDSNLRFLMGKEAQKRVKEHFDWPVKAQLIYKYYEELFN